jgi:hypothetical protein
VQTAALSRGNALKHLYAVRWPTDRAMSSAIREQELLTCFARNCTPSRQVPGLLKQVNALAVSTHLKGIGASQCWNGSLCATTSCARGALSPRRRAGRGHSSRGADRILTVGSPCDGRGFSYNTSLGRLRKTPSKRVAMMSSLSPASRSWLVS